MKARAEAQVTSPPRPVAGSSRWREAGRRSPPLAVALWAELFGDGGLLGPPTRRRVLRALPRLVAPALLAAGGSLALGVYPPGATSALRAALLLAAGASLAAGVARGVGRQRVGHALGPRESAELGLLAVLVAALLSSAPSSLGLTGEASLHALVYLVLSAWAALSPLPVALLLLASAAALAALGWVGRGQLAAELPAEGLKLGFAILFVALPAALGWLRRGDGRRAALAAAVRRRRELEERALQLRLLAPVSEVGEKDGGERAERLSEAAVLEAGAAARGLLQVAGAGLRAHAVAAWSLSDDGSELVLWEGRAHGSHLAARLPAGEGPLGGVVKRRAPVRLHGHPRSANHYADATRPGALVAVPLFSREGAHLRGVVVADRLAPEGFSEEEEHLLCGIASLLARAVTAERLILDGHALREEKQGLHRAIESMNRASTPRQVYDALLGSAARLATIDFGAVTLVEGEGEAVSHRISRAALLPLEEGSQAPALDSAGEQLEGRSFTHPGGLVACVVRLGSSLPGRPIRPEEAVVFDAATRLRGLSALKVLPLRAGERVLGTLVVGSRRAGSFQGDVVRQLEVMALQAGDALLRAQLFEATERLATTDGLTGLVNHRTFQERLERRLAEARRYGKKLSLLLTDVDHFKAVNDTYGHPAGDQVLKGVARILQTEARVTDVAARYGGEEFALVMPETDLEGALRTAERIREAVSEATFATGNGDLRVTISIGVAAFPGDGEAKAALVEVADGGLYHAKRHGRNQTVALSRVRARKSGGDGRRRGS